MPKILIVNNSLDPKNFELVNTFKKIMRNAEIVHFSKVTKKLLKDYDAINTCWI